MGFNQRLKQAQSALGVTGFTGAAPQTLTGGAVLMKNVAFGTLVANIYAKATTNTLTITHKWQVSDDGTTWRDAYASNRAANVATVTGTGSAVTDNVAVAAPDSCYGKRYSRCLLLSGVGTGGGAGVDEGNISYNYLTPDFL
jgi:hypothetical protein